MGGGRGEEEEEESGKWTEAHDKVSPWKRLNSGRGSAPPTTYSPTWGTSAPDGRLSREESRCSVGDEIVSDRWSVYSTRGERRGRQVGILAEAVRSLSTSRCQPLEGGATKGIKNLHKSAPTCQKDLIYSANVANSHAAAAILPLLRQLTGSPLAHSQAHSFTPRISTLFRARFAISKCSLHVRGGAGGC